MKKQKTDAETAKSMHDRAARHDYPLTEAELKADLTEKEKMIDELELKIKLRERLIDEQRSHIEILKEELKKKRWWRVW